MWKFMRAQLDFEVEDKKISVSTNLTMKVKKFEMFSKIYHVIVKIYDDLKFDVEVMWCENSWYNWSDHESKKIWNVLVILKLSCHVKIYDDLKFDVEVMWCENFSLNWSDYESKKIWDV